MDQHQMAGAVDLSVMQQAARKRQEERARLEQLEAQVDQMEQHVSTLAALLAAVTARGTGPLVVTRDEMEALEGNMHLKQDQETGDFIMTYDLPREESPEVGS